MSRLYASLIVAPVVAALALLAPAAVTPAAAPAARADVDDTVLGPFTSPAEANRIAGELRREHFVVSVFSMKGKWYVRILVFPPGIDPR